MANKSKRTTRGTAAKPARAMPSPVPIRKSTRRQASPPFVSPAKQPPPVPMNLASKEDDDDALTQATFASTTTPTLEMLSQKQPPLPAPLADVVVFLGASAASDAASPPALGDASSASSVSTDSPSNAATAALKAPPAPLPPMDTARAASASTRAAILKAANQQAEPVICGALQALASFLLHLKEKLHGLSAQDATKLPNSILHATSALGMEMTENPSMMNATRPFLLRSPILVFCQHYVCEVLPGWLKDKWGNRAQCCAVSLCKIRPDKFESFYTHGNLDLTSEGRFWLAANMVLGSRWVMTAPCANPKPG
eukprot:CAMPEP_0168170252 /NCGR_PEP_ID=MMETSP0139_2-20121125/4078_1 /TAXON_ID=44445 /ORGANISM="Pseudo-nitzschia australis, Strain 10249 10 AB" /LENGTH=311 /DNA_ID=CAMNT_0008087737 /DNA_START=230 /DNA_END=1163 /DNA_ORIENTATION=+